MKKKKTKMKAPTTSPAPTYHEDDVIYKLNEDLMDAWVKLREYTAELGEQRIYASEKAIMFAKKHCYAFVRPKKSYIEVCFFTDHQIKNPKLKIETRSKTKFGHTFRLVHADQVEEPLTDWVREAYEKAKAP